MVKLILKMYCVSEINTDREHLYFPLSTSNTFNLRFLFFWLCFTMFDDTRFLPWSYNM